MRQGPNNNRRPRGRHHGGPPGGERSGGHSPGGGNGNGNHVNNGGNRPRSAASLRHQTFDSNCIDVRVRGNAWQVCEKYQALARDAQGAGDRIAAENYLQHAEHYYRIIEAINEATAVEQRQQRPFGAQPDVQPGYFVDGNSAQPPMPGSSDINMNGQQQQPMAQAEVQQRAPAPPNPFFSQDEAEEENQPALVANS